MFSKKVKWTFGIVGTVLTAIALVGAIIGGIKKDQQIAAIIMLALLILAWMAWVELRFSRLISQTKNPIIDTFPRPVIRELYDEPVFVHSREESISGDIPTIDSRFLDFPRATFCMWVKVVPEIRKTKKNRYIFSHTTDWRDDSGHPNAFCLYHSSASPVWGIIFHGDPQKEGEMLLKKTFLSSQGNDGIRLFSVRWRKNQGEFEVLLDNEVKFKLSGFTNWPKPGNKPIFLGGWIAGGWDSYIKTKIFDVRLFSEWLSDEQVRYILKERPDM